MKKSILFLLFTITILSMKAQTPCSELIEYVESNDYGSTYYSYNSSAIKQVVFYDVTDNNYNTHYFAVVQFTSSYTDYIYQVGYNTKFNYSMDYLNSAGKAFWKYIQPYNENLNCGPNLER